MKTSTEIGSASCRIGEEKTVELVGAAGFDAWDFSMFAMCKYDWKAQDLVNTGHPLASPNYLAFARKLKHIGLECGIHCNQSHAPFPTYVPKIRDHLKRAIECTAEAGGEICVVHPDNNKDAEGNSELFLELLPFAKDHGVKIATENMWNWNSELKRSAPAACSTSKSFCDHIDLVNDESFVACLDIGHAQMEGSGSGAANMIRALGKRLKALHVHDNDRIHDSHELPFTMQINFDEMVEALRDIGYDGYMTLEADCYLGKYTDEDLLLGFKKMAQCARTLADKFDNK